ncbi:Dihydroflavonol-4-reductase [Quillaja saponaria]|uniref:Dihydroflavonol-4-reductase n=1 Tax=Quillaja saponaria TaxID=32244 RepID=A0AAD7PCZ0_QUISA|nr:Dihydroflavonol-4-reductase [Quillaja saponaria]
MEGNKGRVCVTGGAGHIASWLIMKLLENGYAVNTTIRSNPVHKEDATFLKSLLGASQNLEIFDADLNNPESFNAAIEGCIGVFHVAHPLEFEENESLEIVTERLVNGTLGILKACLNSKTVKRVVHTSSIASVVYNSKDVDVLDENFWTDIDYVKHNTVVGSYAISKTLTEKAALEFAEQNGMDVVTILPSFVVGPFICPKLAGSVRRALALIFGDKEEHCSYPLGAVHVDDLARAFIFLLHHSNPKGRYICSSEVVTVKMLSEFVSDKYPDLKVPTLDSLQNIKIHKSSVVSSKKLLDAGFKFNYGFEEMFGGAIQCCKDKGHL